MTRTLTTNVHLTAMAIPSAGLPASAVPNRLIGATPSNLQRGSQRRSQTTGGFDPEGDLMNRWNLYHFAGEEPEVLVIFPCPSCIGYLLPLCEQRATPEG